jgi:hypothetical protein
MDRDECPLITEFVSEGQRLDSLDIVLCRLVVRLQAAKCKLTIGILCGENTLYWTTEYCVVQSD